MITLSTNEQNTLLLVIGFNQ